jgi:hypothetical protein
MRLRLAIALAAAVWCGALGGAAAAAGPTQTTTGNILVLLGRGRAAAAAGRSAVAAAAARAGARHAGFDVPQIGLITLRPPRGVAPAAFAASLRRLSGVRTVELEHRRRVQRRTCALRELRIAVDRAGNRERNSPGETTRVARRAR